jgi:hypothetical protein
MVYQQKSQTQLQYYIKIHVVGCTTNFHFNIILDHKNVANWSVHNLQPANS